MGLWLDHSLASYQGKPHHGYKYIIDSSWHKIAKQYIRISWVVKWEGNHSKEECSGHWKILGLWVTIVIIKVMVSDIASWILNAPATDNERFSIISYKRKVKCDSQRASLAIYIMEYIISLAIYIYNGNFLQPEGQAQDLIIRVINLQNKLNSQSWQVFYSKTKP